MALVALCAGLWPPAFSQPRSYSFEAVDTLEKAHPRPLVVFIHTDWCKYCEAMKQSTLKNDRIVSQLDDRFYFVMLNAEERSDIRFGGRTFRFKPAGAGTGIHDLAAALAGDKTGYPLLCILNNMHEMIFQYNGFLTPAELDAMLRKIAPGN